jgi:predicted Rossmann fold flavoprotein
LSEFGETIESKNENLLLNRLLKEGFMKNKKHVLVAGGGAAGMVAAVSAARMGARVTIAERNPRVGKKILATGNGRCNYTNINTSSDYYYGGNPEFTRGALSIFSAGDAIRFFEKLGIEPKVEEQGKVFPMSEQASSVLDVLLYELNKLGVNIICNALVKKITKENDCFFVEIENKDIIKADRVIIATGGKAMPSSGSDGNGYELAAGLGHRITDIFPALVQIMLEGSFFKRIEGVKIKGTAEVISGNRSVVRDSGDILFANYGVSGPPILQISRRAGELLRNGNEAFLKIVMMDKHETEVLKLIEKRFMRDRNKPVDFSFVGLINKRLIPVILSEAGINDVKRPVSEVSLNERKSIARVLTDWRFKIRGTKSWPSAQVTVGGVDTGEIDPNTMESRLVKGLYFAGEIIDVDGYCGGFNLQWSWSSGYVSGFNAATRTD